MAHVEDRILQVPAADEAKTDQVGEGKAEEAIEETNREGRG